MKTMFLAAVAALLVLGGAVNAKPVGSDVDAVPASEAAVPARTGQSSQASNSLQLENPTGLPSYEMRRDGLLINGLLPTNGWQG